MFLLATHSFVTNKILFLNIICTCVFAILNNYNGTVGALVKELVSCATCRGFDARMEQIIVWSIDKKQGLTVNSYKET